MGEIVCSICIAKLFDEDGKKSHITQCGHMFHVDCLDKWTVEKGAFVRCPQCQSSIRLRTDIFPSYDTSYDANKEINRVNELAGISEGCNLLSRKLYQTHSHDIASADSPHQPLMTIFESQPKESDNIENAKHNLIISLMRLSHDVEQMNQEYEDLKNSWEIARAIVMQKDRELDAWQKESKKLNEMILKWKKKYKKNRQKKI